MKFRSRKLSHCVFAFSFQHLHIIINHVLILVLRLFLSIIIIRPASSPSISSSSPGCDQEKRTGRKQDKTRYRIARIEGRG